MNNIGIWMDKEKAHIVRLAGAEEGFETIKSDVEFYRPSGGSGARSAKWGPQDVIQDSKFLEREKHQLKTYFSNLANAIKDADAIVLFGPADTNKKFKKELTNNYKPLATKLKTIIKSDSKTENQLKAMVRDFFNQKK